MAKLSVGVSLQGSSSSISPQLTSSKTLEIGAAEKDASINPQVAVEAAVPAPSSTGAMTPPLDGSLVVSQSPILQPKAQISSDSSIPETTPSAKAPSYAERFKSSLRNLRKISSPTFEEDGTPVVQAPASVLLQTASMWKGHIVAQFHGLIPPPGKIFSDLNPAWGKHGNIVIRTMTETSCLILIPCASTREWVLQIGYWQAGNVAFSVYPWSEEGLMELSELETAPTWAVLKNVPPQMYSLDGISVIASAIGEPLHTEKSKLDPFHFGDTKVKVEICLDSSPPSVIVVRDNQGNSVRVNVVYPRLPPKCCNCGRFGHLLNRCPHPLMRKPLGKAASKPFVAAGVAIKETKISLASVEENMISAEMVAAITSLPQVPSRGTMPSTGSQRPIRSSRSRSRSRARGKSVPRDVVLVKAKEECTVLVSAKEIVHIKEDGVAATVPPEEVDKGIKPQGLVGSEQASRTPVDDGFVEVRRKGSTNFKAVKSHTKRYAAKAAAGNSASYVRESHPGPTYPIDKKRSGSLKGTISSNPTQGMSLGRNTNL